MTRRTLIQTAASATGIAKVLPALAVDCPDPRLSTFDLPSPTLVPQPSPLDGRRILTFNSVIRVNQIEVTRTQNEGFDEYDRHTPENIMALREAFAEGWPGAAMTWALSWRALHDQRPNYVAARRLVRQFHDEYGDDVTFIPGAYFANMYNTREQVNRDIHEALAKLPEFMGKGYRPKSLLAGFLAAENQKYLAEQEGIHVCQGNIWSQFGIDNGDGDGAPSYPFYPSTEHFCKPAQSKKDLIDCVNLDGWTVDFLSARRLGLGEYTVDGKKKGYNSRFGVGPIETIGWYGPDKGLEAMLACTGVHFDTGFKLNQWAWVTNCWEVSLVPQVKNLKVLTKWLRGIRERWPNAECLTQGDFGAAWRKQYKDNSGLDYRFMERGSGLGCSDANLEIKWYMNPTFRLALLRDWKEGLSVAAGSVPASGALGPWRVIDFTRYDIPAHEPKDLGRNWSLMGEINQKQTRPQDKPRLLEELSTQDRELIRKVVGDSLRISLINGQSSRCRSSR
ncbi:MAG: DUF3863 domain-containing protein [Armatimonadetes bacterium]|nr:DUF3863 domain-containing protein [Armatimonadota bacterium]